MLGVAIASLSVLSAAEGTSTVGYYRMPALYRETLVFVAEGDLWRVSSLGGRATRLTSHPGDANSLECRLFRHP